MNDNDQPTSKEADHSDVLPFSLSTVIVTTNGGEQVVYENAAIVGIWSGRLIVTEVETVTPTERAVKTHYVPLEEVNRTEYLFDEEGMSATRWHLQGPGLLGSENELDLTLEGQVFRA